MWYIGILIIFNIVYVDTLRNESNNTNDPTVLLSIKQEILKKRLNDFHLRSSRCYDMDKDDVTLCYINEFYYRKYITAIENSSLIYVEPPVNLFFDKSSCEIYGNVVYICNNNSNHETIGGTYVISLYDIIFHSLLFTSICALIINIIIFICSKNCRNSNPHIMRYHLNWWVLFRYILIYFELIMPNMCYYIAVSKHLTNLMLCSWFSCLSYNICSIVVASSKNTKASINKIGVSLLLVYILPLLIILLSIILDNSNVICTWKLGYGINCSIYNRDAAIILLIMPMLFFCIISTFYFIYSSILLYKIGVQNPNSTFNIRHEFVVLLRLFFLSGFIWFLNLTLLIFPNYILGHIYDMFIASYGICLSVAFFWSFPHEVQQAITENNNNILGKFLKILYGQVDNKIKKVITPTS